MATYNKFQPFVAAIAHKEHDLENDQLAIALLPSGSAPTNTMSGWSQISGSEIGNYANLSGGTTALNVSTSASSQTGGVYTLVLEDMTLTASGTVGPFRYVVLYNKTASAGDNNLIGWWDYGASVTMADTETFDIDFSAYTVRISG
jgi:hypothetical protein